MVHGKFGAISVPAFCITKICFVLLLIFSCTAAISFDKCNDASSVQIYSPFIHIKKVFLCYEVQYNKGFSMHLANEGKSA